jgi:ABC-type amino acid transport substrate-binding protein
MAMPIGKKATLLLFALILSGCAAPFQEFKEVAPDAFRVGVTSDYPPMIFKQKDDFKGVEADLAARLAKMLGRPVEFVELTWDRQIPALMEGKIDIIMSGMTITEARKTRINFTSPYLKGGLVTLLRAEDSRKFTSLKAIRETLSAVAVVQGTTSETYVRKNFPNAPVIAIQKAADVPFLMKSRRIDLFVDDLPSVAWLVSENEGLLKGFWEPLSEEAFGWGVRREDRELLGRIEAILKTFKRDGTLKEVLSRWLPYWKEFD